jgi:EpsI family protein
MSSSVHRWWGCVLAGVVLLAGGWGYRRTAGAIQADVSATIRLERPLALLPLVIGPWQGHDVEIPEGVQRIVRNDDFISRSYRDAQTGEIVHLYIGYTARPRTMLRHRPTVCYPSAGWSHLSSKGVELAVPASGRALPALVHLFLKPGTADRHTVVLNYYVLNGRVTADESSFESLSWRDPNLGRDATRYVAQVQIAVPADFAPNAAEQTARRFAAESAQAILDLLPGPARAVGAN